MSALKQAGRPRTAKGTASSVKKGAHASRAEALNTDYLETLLGYNARRAALHIIGQSAQKMALYDLKPVDFSVMSVVHHNPGVTSRQLCASLDILPPNLVKIIQSLEAREWIARQPHPHDGRAVGLHPTDKGMALMQEAESRIAALEKRVASKLSPAQQDQLISLLRKIYL
jgi:DNA-binding MarR family transcriptional regulator